MPTLSTLGKLGRVRCVLDVGRGHSPDFLLDGRLDRIRGPLQVVGVRFARFEVLVHVRDLKVACPLARPGAQDA